MIVNIMNKDHFLIKIGHYEFPPYKEIDINVGVQDSIFRQIRSCKSLRVGKDRIENKYYIKKHKLKSGYDFNVCYDVISQHAGEAYIYAIEALANPILENLKNYSAGFVNRPAPGENGKGINCRFFSSMRINQQGKCPVGPYDVFISHGIADKNYWIGKRINDFKFAFCPGPLWEKRMRNTGYKGEIFQVGYTKLDPILQNKITKTKREKPYIAWLPTHGYNNKHKGRSSYPEFNNFITLFPNIYEIDKGLHPTSKMNSKEKQMPTMQKLVDANVVIADGGSTIYEAWAVGKPVIFPDWLCKKDIINHFGPENLEHQIYSKQIGYHAKDFKHMLKLIEEALTNGMKDCEKEFIENIFPEKYRGKSGKLAAESLKQIKNNI